MSVNKHCPHIYVLPEDDANRQIANGFLLGMNVNNRAIQILPEVGGWQKAVEKLTKEHAPEMRTYSNRRIVLLIDFDSLEEKQDAEKRSANCFTDRKQWTKQGERKTLSGKRSRGRVDLKTA